MAALIASVAGAFGASSPVGAAGEVVATYECAFRGPTADAAIGIATWTIPSYTTEWSVTYEGGTVVSVGDFETTLVTDVAPAFTIGSHAWTAFENGLEVDSGTIEVTDACLRLPPLRSTQPARLLETRSGPGLVTADGQFQGIGQRPAGSVLELTVAGRSGVPADASAAILNVTAVQPAGPGYLTVFPCGDTQPTASNVNYGAGQFVPNNVLAKIGADGKVCIYTLAATDILVDLNGFVPAGGSPAPLVPARLLETRSGPGLDTVDGQFQGGGQSAAGSVVELLVAGRGGVPADATAVLLNVTAVQPAAAGYLTVFPCGSEQPTASNVNYGAGDVVPNAVLAKVGVGGKVCIYTLAAADLIVDVNGYALSAAAPTPIIPRRLLETRTGPGLLTGDGAFQGYGRREAGSITELIVTGRMAIPTSDSVMLNVTAVFPDGPGYLTVFPCGTTPPAASNVNYGAGQVVANAVLAKVTPDRTVCIYTLAATDIVVDITGYVLGEVGAG